MGYGVTVPDGSLQVFSTDTVSQAQALIVAACSTNLRGEYIAPELAQEQTIDNLNAFGDRLAEFAERMNLFGESNEDSDEGEPDKPSDDSPRRLPGSRRGAKKSKSRRANSKRSRRG